MEVKRLHAVEPGGARDLPHEAEGGEMIRFAMTVTLGWRRRGLHERGNMKHIAQLYVCIYNVGYSAAVCVQ